MNPTHELVAHMGGWVRAHAHRRPRVRSCVASGWLVTVACVDRLGHGVQCCPHCSAPVRCERVDARDVRIPRHRPLSAVVVKAVDHG